MVKRWGRRRKPKGNDGPPPEKFQWRKGDIEWIKPPKSLKKRKDDGKDA